MDLKPSIFLGSKAIAAYNPAAMTRSQIELSIKIFIVLLIVAFIGSFTHVMRMLGWA